MSKSNSLFTASLPPVLFSLWTVENDLTQVKLDHVTPQFQILQCHVTAYKINPS